MKFFKKLAIIISTFICVLIFVVFGFRSFFMLSTNDYYNASIKAFEIPGINDNFVAQGLDYDVRSDSFFVTGYISKKASPIYMVNKTNKKVKKVKLYMDDKELITHAGGIAVTDDYIYIAGGSEHCLFVYSYEQVINANNNDKVNALGTFSLEINKDDYLGPAFVLRNENELIVGEFYRKQNYKTLDSHKITTKNGDYNQALALSFSLTSDEFGLSTKPNKAYSLPDLVQGMCFYEDKIFVSTSYGLAFSHILSYDVNKLVRQDDVTILDTTLPLYALDSASLIKKTKIPPMSEELIVLDNRLYVMCESASNHYIFGKFTSSMWCYATKLDKFF